MSSSLLSRQCDCHSSDCFHIAAFPLCPPSSSPWAIPERYPRAQRSILVPHVSTLSTVLSSTQHS